MATYINGNRIYSKLARNCLVLKKSVFLRSQIYVIYLHVCKTFLLYPVYVYYKDLFFLRLKLSIHFQIKHLKCHLVVIQNIHLRAGKVNLLLRNCITRFHNIIGTNTISYLHSYENVYISLSKLYYNFLCDLSRVQIYF